MLKNILTARLAQVKESGLYRRLRAVESAQDTTVVLDGQEVLLFSSNNYLGLANHPALKRAAQEAIERYGCGSGASRLISGSMDVHHRLEQRLASLKQTEAALVFPTGYHANIGVLSALMGPEDTILSDALNHASIIDGCRLSRANTNVYHHCDTAHLAELLTACPQSAASHGHPLVAPHVGPASRHQPYLGVSRLESPWAQTPTEWLKFLRLIDDQTQKDKPLHLIATTDATHKHPKVQPSRGQGETRLDARCSITRPATGRCLIGL